MFDGFFDKIDLDGVSVGEREKVNTFMYLTCTRNYSWHDPVHAHALRILCGQVRAFGGDPHMAAGAYNNAMGAYKQAYRDYCEKNQDRLPREQVEKYWDENPGDVPPDLEKMFDRAHAWAMSVVKKVYVDKVVSRTLRSSKREWS